MSNEHKKQLKVGDTIIDTKTKQKGFVIDLSVFNESIYVHHNMHPKKGMLSSNVYRFVPCKNLLIEKI